MVRLYADECVNGFIRALRTHGVDITTAQEDGRTREPDASVLNRATELGRVLFSQDEDLLTEAAARQRRGRTFSGVIFAHQQHVPLGVCIEQLELIASATDPTDYLDRVEYLPL